MKLTPANFQRYLVFSGFLAGIGFVATWAFHWATTYLQINIPWWLEVPGTLAIAGFLYSIYHKHAWSWRIFCVLGITDVPDLRGRWEGCIYSSYNQKKESVPAVVEINQTASDIQLNLYTAQSFSSSVVANFSKDSDGATCIYYSYRNETGRQAVDGMHIHYGSSQMRYHPDIMKLDGHYYTTRDRGNYGEMEFEYKDRELLYRFKK